MLLTLIAMVLVAVIAFVFIAQTRWRRLADDELTRLAEGADWKLWKPAIGELRRRGRDINEFLPHLARRLLAPDRMERESARATLIDLYPVHGQRLMESGYVAKDEPANSRPIVEKLFGPL